MEVLLCDLSSRKSKSNVPGKMLADFHDDIKNHKAKILEFRDQSEKLASIKDAKAFTKKDAMLQHTPHAETEMLESKKPSRQRKQCCTCTQW